jgi:hypothetical protein
MHVTGEVEFIDDPELQRKAAAEGAFLEKLTGKRLEHLWENFRIRSGEACFWTLADTLKEPDLARICF